MSEGMLLNVTNLHKQYGSTHAVRGLSFSIRKGSCTALLGPNGAGKTTTLKMITGLSKPTSGVIEFAGRDAQADIRKYLGYLPQYPAFFGWMSALEYLQFAGELTGLSPAETKERARELLERVGLKDAAKRRVGGYSGGMKQRLGIAQAMIHSPELLVLDEPVSALDPIGRRELMDLIAELKEETTILFSTHVLHDAEEICDDVLIIRQGELVLEGPLFAVMQQHSKPEMIIAFAPTEAEAVIVHTAELFAKLETVKGVERTGGELKLRVTEMNDARTELIQVIAENQLPIMRFEAGGVTLEDLFMKAVAQ